ncbi:golgin subfamily A member 1 isoform X3 [Diprion similis]|uniref:golgin subfamily A member 1 isoform X3 n=1 Tax=Diprion similis TaxID=362088 RepID=UPI001EF96BC1|nr:golgin subfamily A member 1 isoform X3 [Diprion similis]
MFVSLKNKIREETGSDVSTVVRKAGNVRNVGTRHTSQTGSTSSISGSMVSLDGSREENMVSPTPPIQLKRENSFEYKLSDGMQLSSKDIKRIESREDEWRKRLARRESELVKKLEKKDEEWKVRLQEREKEWKKLLDKQEKEKLKLEDERKKAEDARRVTELALKNAEEYKKKLYSFQEDAEQLEGFQTQEMAKIKHLLLAKEQEVEEKVHHLKNATAEVESLKTEVSRLRRYEDELNNVQESSSREIKQLKKDLQEVTSKHSLATTELAQLKLSLDGEKTSNASLHLEVARLRETLETERTTTAKLRITLEKEREEKDVALLRNAQVSQDVEMVKQECRRQESENNELQSRVNNLEKTIKTANTELEKCQTQLAETRLRIEELETMEHSRELAEGNEKMLKNSILDLEDQLNEKSKTIKVLQQRLADMKKTLQRELRIPSSSLDSDAEPTGTATAVISPSSTKTVTPRQNNSREEDVNFKYLKHVLIKFLTSREYEVHSKTCWSVKTRSVNERNLIYFVRSDEIYLNFYLFTLGSALDQSSCNSTPFFPGGRKTAAGNFGMENVVVWKSSKFGNWPNSKSDTTKLIVGLNS